MEVDDARSQFLRCAHVILDRLKEPRLSEWWLDIRWMIRDLKVWHVYLYQFDRAWLPNIEYRVEDEANEVRCATALNWSFGNQWTPECFSISNVETNAANWRELPLSSLRLSPASTSLLYKAEILFIGQLQDLVLANPEDWWTCITGLRGPIAAAIADKLADFAKPLNEKKVRFAFLDPYESMDFVGYDLKTWFGFGVTTRLLPAVENGTNDERKIIFDDIRRDAICCIKAWIRYAETEKYPFDVQEDEQTGGTPEFQTTEDGDLNTIALPQERNPSEETRNEDPCVAGSIESTAVGNVPHPPPVYENLPKLFLRRVIGTMRGGGRLSDKTLIPALVALKVRLHPDFDPSSSAFDLPVDVSSLSGLPTIKDPESRANALDAWLQSDDNKKRRSKATLGTKPGTKLGNT